MSRKESRPSWKSANRYLRIDLRGGQGFRPLAPSPKTHYFFLPMRMLVWGLVGLCTGVVRPADSIRAATSR